MLVLVAGCRPATELPPDPAGALAVSFTDLERSRISSLTGLGTPPADPTNGVADDPAAAALGQWLYFDERFSSNGAISCASCHDPARGYGDSSQLADGVDAGTRHAPTVLNSAYQRWFFWDGRCDTLWCQAAQPLESDHEHGGDRLMFAHLVAGDADLSSAYEALFGALPDLSDAARFPEHAKPHSDYDDDPAVLLSLIHI